MKRALVTGAGGFIGHDMCAYLKHKGYWVRAVDYKSPEYGRCEADEGDFNCDLRIYKNAMDALGGAPFDEVYHFAADMGGIGFITKDFAKLTRNSAMINTNMLESARAAEVGRFFFSSSACVYRQDKQNTTDAPALREEDAWPADPEPGYGLEKLFMEKLCEYFADTYNMVTRVARFHNVYGPEGTYCGGREKSPAAMCRKVAEAADGDTIEVWGDGEQTRSFLYVDDCCEGVYQLMQSDHGEPLNIGSDHMVSINELALLVARVAEKDIKLKHIDGPQGVRGRNSDNTRMRSVLGWEPKVSLQDGIAKTYAWIEQRIDPVRASARAMRRFIMEQED